MTASPKRYIKPLLTIIALLGTVLPGRAFSFALDSIAAGGRFPAFCVKVYRAGDRIFNSTDTAYVKSPGYPFKVSLTSDSWLNFYNFYFPEEMKMRMASNPSTTVGVHLSWLAVSIGYDYNVSELLGFKSLGRQRWNFGFNSSRLVANFSVTSSDGGMRILAISSGDRTVRPHINFNDGHSRQWYLSAVYFFNHLRYSHSAAFGFGKIQIRSAGSWFAGISFSGQRYSFDFSNLPQYCASVFPEGTTIGEYSVMTHLWGITGGYAANITLGREWILALKEAPTLGLRRGYISSEKRRDKFGIANTFDASLVYNHNRHWYMGAVARVYGQLIYSSDNAMNNWLATFNITAGYRF